MIFHYLKDGFWEKNMDVKIDRYTSEKCYKKSEIRNQQFVQQTNSEGEIRPATPWWRLWVHVEEKVIVFVCGVPLVISLATTMTDIETVRFTTKSHKLLEKKL